MSSFNLFVAQLDVYLDEFFPQYLFNRFFPLVVAKFNEAPQCGCSNSRNVNLHPMIGPQLDMKLWSSLVVSAWVANDMTFGIISNCIC